MPPAFALNRIAPRVAIGILLLLLVAEVYSGLVSPNGYFRPGSLGHDYELYMDATRSWLAGGSYYHPYQVVGPYEVRTEEVLYPPHALVLFVPFTLLPAIAWWAVPLGLIVRSVLAARPGPWTCAAILACLAMPRTLSLLTNGNPTIWIAAGLTFRWWGALFLKPTPTFLLLSLLGLRTRALWIGLAVTVAVDLALLGLSRDYLAVIVNARGVSPLYALADLGLLAIPLLALLRPGHRRRTVQPGAREASPSGLEQGAPG